MYHAKKIGIFISHIFGNFQSCLCQGIIDKASEFGYAVEIFSSTDGEDLGSYSLGETSILRIPNFDEFSGICLASGTYLLPSLKNSITDALRNQCACPIIEITQSDASFPSVALDNDTVAGQLTEHMITTHQHKRICYLGNSLEPDFSRKRFHCYREIMKKYKLPVSEEDYCFCDYEYTSIESALRHFLQKGKPDSIICYNDRMAISLIDAIYKHGFRIPEDIAITGFDCLEIGRHISPALSTVTFPIYEMGQKAMELLLDAMKGIPLPANTAVTAEPLYLRSCGCNKKKEQPLRLYGRHLMERINTLENSMLNDIKMYSTLCGIRDLDEGMELLEKFIPRIGNCSELYICLYQNWNYVSPHIHAITSTQEEEEDCDILIMPFSYRNGKRLPKCSFTKKSILPDYIYTNSQSSYIYSPLFFQEREFGYVALAYQDNRLSFQFDFLTWIANVSRMLKNIYEARRTDLLVNRLEDIYVRDDLTGLYNRQGFRQMADSLLKQARKTNGMLLAMIFDLDDLKTINDAFGYSEGNFAIQVLGHALNHIHQKEAVISHPGEDEFYLLAAGLTETDAQEITLNINKYLENYNRLHTKKYNIRVSSSYVIKNACYITDIHEIFDDAGKEMEKRRKSKSSIIL